MLANKVNKTKKVMVHKISVEQYSKYEKLLKAIAEQEHQSCLIFNSSIRPKQMDSFVNNSRRVKEFLLEGLNNQDCQELLNNFQFKDSTTGSIETLIQQYRGHPLALQSAAKTIQWRNGNIADFLKGTFFIGDVMNDLLDKQFSYLSNSEINIMQKLAYEEEPISLLEIYEFFLSISKLNIEKSLKKLWKIGLIAQTQNNQEKFVTFWISYPLISKYIRNRYQ